MSGNEGVECIINAAVRAMKEAFSAASSNPPLGGGTELVRFFAGEATPLSAWDIHITDVGCAKDPFLWVRLVRRYRSRQFPAPYVGADNCGSPVVIAVEVGVARCAAMNQDDAGMSDYESEAEVSLDDSWRIELAMCRAATIMRSQLCSDAQALDAVLPIGPDGGLYGWSGQFLAQVST